MHAGRWVSPPAACSPTRISPMATRDTVDAEASRLVGRYELLAPVVSGALGELWQARIASGPEEGRVVDIRRISRAVGLEKRDVERLTNAAFAAMELRNPRIAAVLDVVALTVPAMLARPDVIAYRAPEQLEPGRAIDERADVFAVGILLWEMIAGRTLFGPAALPRAPSVVAPGKMRADPIAVSGA